MSTTNNQLTQLLKELQTMYEMVLEAYKYMPVIYEQQNILDGNNTIDEYVIKTPLNNIPPNSLLYMLPRYTSSNDTIYLRIIFGDGNSKSYEVYLEDTDGTPTKAGSGSIIANRLAMFRVSMGIISTGSFSREVMILTNNPCHNTLATTHLHVSDTALFAKMPMVIPDSFDTVDNISKGRELVLYSDYLDLLNRVKTLENRIVIGTKEVSEIKDELEEGQIYLKVEDLEV